MDRKSFVVKEAAIDRPVHHWMHKQPACCVWGVAELDSPLSDEIIEKALVILINTVPILSARLKKGWWRGYWEFVEPGDMKSLITRKRLSDNKRGKRLLKGVIRNPIDADKPPLIRITSIDLPGEHFFILQVHHTVMDGEGAKQVFNLFAEIYRELERDPQWLPHNYPAMDRDWLQIAKHLNWRTFLMVPFIAFKELVALVYILLLRRTASVITGDFPGKNKALYPEDPQTETFLIKETEIKSIKKNLQEHGATLNDLIMSALMTTINTWNSDRGERFSHVFSCYTADLRTWWGPPKGTFTNMSIICTAFAGTEYLSDVRKALKALKPKFDKAKREFGLKEIWDLLILRVQPELISRIAGFLILRLAKKAHALTNIGIIPESTGDFGRVSAKSYSVIAPFFPSPNLIFTVTSFKNDLTVHCNFDGTHIKSETARDFIGRFKDNMLEFACLGLKGPGKVV